MILLTPHYSIFPGFMQFLFDKKKPSGNKLSQIQPKNRHQKTLPAVTRDIIAKKTLPAAIPHHPPGGQSTNKISKNIPKY